MMWLLQAAVLAVILPAYVDSSATVQQYAAGNDGDVTQQGILYMLSRGGDFYAAQLKTQQSEINSLPLREKGSNETSNPFRSLVPLSEGTQDREVALPSDTGKHHSVVSETFWHHVYIAEGNEVIVVGLDTNDTVYERVDIGHAPLLIRVYNLSGDLLMFVFYEDNSRGFAVTYRNVTGYGWSRYGNPVLVYSPDWYDIEDLSNVVIFEAQDFIHLSRTTVYAAVAFQWRVYIIGLIDTNFYQLQVPEPCDNIKRLTFNEQKQTIFIECLEGTTYSVFRDDLYYSSELWGGTDAFNGETVFSGNGQYGAIVSNSNSTLAVVDLRINGDTARYVTVNVTGEVDQLRFVSINDSNHFLCYVQVREKEEEGGGVYWVHVESALESPNDVEIARGQLLTTDEGSYLKISAHDSLLAVTRVGGCVNRSSCGSVELYDMETQTNTWSISGITPLFQAWMPHPQPIAIATNASQIPDPGYETNTQPTMSPVPVPNPGNGTNTQPTTSPVPVPNPGNETSEPTERTAMTSPATDATHRPHPPTTPQYRPTPLPPSPSSSCEADLHAANKAYDRLLWVAVTVCICFCLAMVVSIALLVAVIWMTRQSMRQSTNCAMCAHVGKYEEQLSLKVLN